MIENRKLLCKNRKELQLFVLAIIHSLSFYHFTIISLLSLIGIRSSEFLIQLEQPRSY